MIDAVRFLTVGASVLLLSAACSSSNGGSGAMTCPAGTDAGSFAGGGTESVSEGGRCAGLSGTKQSGDACTQDSECTPVCCACPNSGKTASVAWCSQGKCVVGAEVCCAFVAGDGFGDGGVPFVCK
jgi:hypothetical protein